jgi:hypothetical protein
MEGFQITRKKGERNSTLMNDRFFAILYQAHTITPYELNILRELSATDGRWSHPMCAQASLPNDPTPPLLKISGKYNVSE